MVPQNQTTLHVNGTEYLTPADACDLLIAAGLRSSAAYAQLARLAKAGTIRTTPTSSRTRAYHAGDVIELAKAIRSER
jgi:D-serine deaminase-like pyridoxal phosphate-dependent protein